jgi:GT2 family glycosyltransferase
MRAARGELFAFIDDDCIVDPTYFSALLECYADDPNAVRGGRVEGDEDDLAVSIRPSPDAAVYTSDLKPGGFILGCNFVVPRRLAERIGRFDERFGAGGRYRSAEDTDYVLRAHLAGAPVLYEPAMRVTHHHGRRTHRALRDIIWAYETGNGALYAKHARACPWLSRHVGWTLRNALKEWIGGSKFIPELDVSHWSVFGANLKGVFRYAVDAAGDQLRGVARSGANAHRMFEAAQSRSASLRRRASRPASECG